MNNQKKKDEIVRTLENGDVSSACHLLFSLPPYEIYSLLNKKFTDKYVLHILYGAFIPDQHIKVFKPFIDEIVLDHYLQKCIEPIHEFEAFLVADYPELLINAIRVNRSFMDDKVYDRLTGFAWDEKQRPHLLIWKEFRAIESALWENAEKYRTKYDEETLEEQFVALTLWVEEELFYAADQELNHHLSKCYELIITETLGSKDRSILLDQDLLDQNLYNALKEKKITNRSYFQAISEWIAFRDGLFASYCYDLNFEPAFENGELHFGPRSEEVYSKWQIDGVRYMVNDKRYYLSAAEITQYGIENGTFKVPSGYYDRDKDINEEVMLRSFKGKHYLDHLYLENLRYGKSTVPLAKPLQLLNGFSFNRWDRYDHALLQNKMRGFDFYESCLMNIQHWVMRSKVQQIDLNIPNPFYFDTLTGTAQMFRSFEEFEMDTEEAESFVELFSYFIPKKEFDRWNVHYDVQKTPFIKIGKYLFCPLSFITYNEWFYSLGQRALDIINRIPKKKYPNQRTWEEMERKRTSDRMENELAQKFKDRGWKTKVISDQESSKMDGDIDLFVSDNNTQLLIQLKRTTFKLDLSGARKEHFETDLKAAGQINEMIACVKESPSILDIEIDTNATKWIVSTSYEGTLNRIDDCSKINYFDLVWALENKNLKFREICDLIEYMESDGPFKDGQFLLDLL